MPDRAPPVLTPYARSIGIGVANHSNQSNDAPILRVAFGPMVEGRPGALHGGATSGLLETAGYAAMRAELATLNRVHRLKPINVTVQFLSAGKAYDTFAVGCVTRLGRRNANVAVEAWQNDRSRLIASAVMNILMAEPE